MVTPVDTSIYNNLPNPNQGVQTLGSMVGIAQGMQSLQSQKNANVQSGIDAQETQNLQPVLRNTAAYTDERGNVDFNKFVPMVMQAAPKNGAGIIKNFSDMQAQKAQAQNAISTQSAAALQRASNAIFSIDPAKATPEMLQQTADAINTNFTDPNAQHATNQIFGNISKTIAATKPDDPLRKTQLEHVAMMYQPIEAQQAINTPVPVQMSNQQQTWLQNIKPGVAGSPQNQPIANTAVQQQLAPSTQVMRGNTPGYLGPQMGGQSPLGAQQPSGFVAAGLPVGSTGNIEDANKEMNRHFAGLQDSATGTQLAQGLTGNIKALAQTAATGTNQDKKAYISGLLQSLNIPGTGDLKTDTDLLEKNMAQLNLSSPASSDAARALIGAARPHSTMSAKAISDAADQLASQVQANMAIRNSLSGYKYANGGQGDAVSYQTQRQNIEKVADPRIWQYQSLQPGSKAAQDFIKNLTPADRKSLIKKAEQAEKMGLL